MNDQKSTGNSLTAPNIYLVIPAGGRGERMGGGVPKQFRDFGGKPLLKATVEAFLKPGMPQLAGLALAVPPDRIHEAQSWSFGLPSWVVEGGASRQTSVLAALTTLPDEPEFKCVPIQPAHSFKLFFALHRAAHASILRNGIGKANAPRKAGTVRGRSHTAG